MALSDLIVPPQPPDTAPDRAAFGDQYDIKINDLRRDIKTVVDLIETATLTPSGVDPGDYPDPGEIPTFTVDLYGRLTAAGSVPMTIAPMSLATAGINPDPGPATGNNVDPLVPPSLTTAGPTFVNSDTSNGNVVISTNNAPTDSFNTFFYNSGSPAAQFIFQPNGTIVVRRTGTAPSGDAGNAAFTQIMSVDINGNIFSNGPVQRGFAAGIEMPGAAKVLQMQVSVPYGKTFHGTLPPSSIVYNNISSVTTIVTVTPRYDYAEVLLQSNDLVNGTTSIYARGTLSITL